MKRSRRKGSALLITILIMAVLTIIGASLLSLSLADTRNSVSQDKKTQAHYIGRSGVYVGYDLLNKQLASKDYSELDTLVTDLNTAAGSLSASNKLVSDKGSFSLSYERFSPDEIKISSTGTTAGANAYSELVTFIVKVMPAMSMQSNPDEWITGVNLKKGVLGGASNIYLGKGVELSGRPIQSPQNSAVDATYQASVLYFKDWTGGHSSLSLQQKPESKTVNFDAEIIYFESGVELNNTPNPVKLLISTDVINYRVNNAGVLPKYSVNVGFEDENRYITFIGSYTDNNYSIYAPQFISGSKYGLVYFGGDVYEFHGTTKILSGYYFYRSGVDLHNPVPGDLIKINNNDAIIKALNNLFKSSASSSGFIWNKD